MNFDVLIKGGTVVDGTGGAPFPADVGISGGRIAHVGAADGATAGKTLNASGMIVCPGIVDPHSHADLSISKPDHHLILEPLIRQGITTIVTGNCGMSLAPVEEKNRDFIKDYIEAFTKFDFDREIQWRTVGEFLDALESRGVVLNTALLAPHGLLRINAMGASLSTAADDEIGSMKKALDAALEQGAIGLSTGLQYFPGNQSDTRELIELAGVVAKHGGIFTSHLRSYSNTLTLAVDEVLEVGEKTGAPVQISHIFWAPDAGLLGPLLRPAARALAGLSRWWSVPLPLHRPLAAVIKRVMDARDRGVRAGMDVMPTTTAFTHMLAFFPPWALMGGLGKILERLRDPDQRRKMLHSIEHGKMVWPHTGEDSWSLNFFRVMGWTCARIMSVGSEKNRHLEGRTLLGIAADAKKHPFDAACDLLVEENGCVLVFASMAHPEDAFTERTTFAPIRHPEVFISTDTVLMGFGKPSHLFYSCYPKFLCRYVFGMKMLPLEQAIRKITSLPADHFGLKQRGRLEKNYHADVLVFDPEKLENRATFDNPRAYPSGIEHVFINGRHVLDGAAYNPVPRPGTVIRGA
ncbi:MAG: amidohydrolase family protein [bacterium]